MGSAAASTVGGGRRRLQGPGKKPRGKNKRGESAPQTWVAYQRKPPSGLEAERRQINRTPSSTRRQQRRLREKSQREQTAFGPPPGENEHRRRRRAAAPGARRAERTGAGDRCTRGGPERGGLLVTVGCASGGELPSSGVDEPSWRHNVRPSFYARWETRRRCCGARSVCFVFNADRKAPRAQRFTRPMDCVTRYLIGSSWMR